MGFTVPSRAELKDMVGLIFDGADVNEAEPFELEAPALHFGAYIDDDDNLAGVLVCDAAFGAYASCAMTMLPLPVAQDAIKSGSLEEMMVSNLREVMNILSRLFMLRGADHLRFDRLYSVKKGQMPENINEYMNGADKKSWFRAAIPNYGDGQLGFVTTS